MLETNENVIKIGKDTKLNITVGKNTINIGTSPDMNITIAKPYIKVTMAEKGIKGVDGRDYYIQNDQPLTNQDTYFWIKLHDNGDFEFLFEDGK